MRIAVLALAAALAAPAAPAVAQTPDDRSDVRCLLVLQAIARDPKQKENAGRGVYFYMGRLAARGGLVRVEPLMLSEARAISSAAQVQAELTRCAAELTKRTAEMQAANQRLQKQVQPAAKAPPAKK